MQKPFFVIYQLNSHCSCYLCVNYACVCYNNFERNIIWNALEHSNWTCLFCSYMFAKSKFCFCVENQVCDSVNRTAQTVFLSDSLSTFCRTLPTKSGVKGNT